MAREEVTPSNLEKEFKDFDLCPITRRCNPDEEEVENFCVLNYANCEKYLLHKKEEEQTKKQYEEDLEDGKR